MKPFLRLLIIATIFSDVTWSQTAYKAMVVSARQEASAIGASILQQGGTVFDAMIATEMALAVAYPYAGNLGGGGFMVYRLANGQTGSLDYRERAPLCAYATMYLDEKGNIIAGGSTEGAQSVAVPGTIAGIFEVHKKFGTLPIETLLKPAISLARRGVVVTEREAKRIAEHRPKIVQISGDQTLYNRPVRVGDTIKYVALASSLEKLIQYGKSVFYEGEMAQKLVAFLQQRGSEISLDDLKSYQAVWRKPIEFDYKKCHLISMGPPSSGGVTLAEILGMLAGFDVSKYKPNSAEYLQLLTEAERRAYADRNRYLGDPDFVSMPIKELLDAHYLRSRMSSFRWEAATPSSSVGAGVLAGYESDETTHYSIVDRMGNALAATTTLNGAYGSKLYCDQLGFFLNNQMDDFSAKPGVPNAYGLVGSKANAIAPGKRMLSSMTPTIVTENGHLRLVVGTPGGSTIITSVLQTFLNVFTFQLPIQQAVAAPRFHHQWLPDEIWLDPKGYSAEVQQQLKSKGYFPIEKQAPVIGKVDAIYIHDNGQVEGGADPRGDDAAVGIE
jgi:gamma-glutamyltranspeptidase/glutathione hydrolase